MDNNEGPYKHPSQHPRESQYQKAQSVRLVGGSPTSPEESFQSPYHNNSSEDVRGTQYTFNYGADSPHSPQTPVNISPTHSRHPSSSSYFLPREGFLSGRAHSEFYADSISTGATGFYERGSQYNSQSNLLGALTPTSRPTSTLVGSSLALDNEGDLGVSRRNPTSSGRSGWISGTTLDVEKNSDDISLRNWKEDGTVIRTSKRDDDAHMPRWKRFLFTTTPFWILLSITSYWLYFAMRIYCTIQAQRRHESVSFVMAYLFTLMELVVTVPNMLHLFLNLFILKPRKRPQLRLVGNDVPAVDVFITCCKEETDLVLDTVRGACDVDYPYDRFRVVVLDDGADKDLEEQCKLLNDTMYPNLFYRSREKIPGKPHHFKAGNLNYGFQEVKNMPGGAAAFAAALDADMIPEPQWLRALMPHMLVDDRMALACPPQLFYNTPPGDPLSQSLDFFVHVLEGIKDALGVAWCTGSGYVLRREALEEIGWFPLGSLAEDVATSTLMLGKGWKTAFVHEPLQFGTVPDSFGSHLKQRTRWAIGTVDTAVKLKFCLYGKGIAKMTFFQRLSGFIYAVLAVFNVFSILSMLALPIVLISGKPVVAYVDTFQLHLLIWLNFAALVSNRLTEFFTGIPAGYSVSQNSQRGHFWMSPYIAITLLRAFVLPNWLGGEAQSFKPTGSISSDLNERDALLRAGLARRLYTIVFQYSAWIHMVYVYFTLTAVTLSSTRCIAENSTWRNRLLCLLVHSCWPPLTWTIVCTAMWIPISYAIDPPTVPPREELLNRDPKTGVAHPKESSKKVVFGAGRFFFELQYALITLFTCFIFATVWIWL